MRSPSSHANALVAAIASCALLAACGSEEEPSESAAPEPAPAASEFPKPRADLESLGGDVTPTDEVVASPAGAVFEPSREPQRFGFGMFDVSGTQISDAEVAIYAAHGADGRALGPFPARVESLETEPAFVAKTTADDPDAAKVVYVADVPLTKPGEWRLVAVMNTEDGLVATRLPSINVEEMPRIPEPGERAPSVHTPTLEDVGADVESIDTRVPPSSMHEHDLVEVLGREPVVLLFATPALCVSRVCGPVVDVAEQVKSDYGDEAAFIHMEIYEDNVPDPQNLRSQVEAYGLPTEPWLFVMDDNGRVVERIEGAFSVSELERAVEKATGRSA